MFYSISIRSRRVYRPCKVTPLTQDPDSGSQVESYLINQVILMQVNRVNAARCMWLYDTFPLGYIFLDLPRPPVEKSSKVIRITVKYIFEINNIHSEFRNFKTWPIHSISCLHVCHVVYRYA